MFPLPAPRASSHSLFFPVSSGCFCGLPFSSQDCHRVSGIGKPVLCSASRPPATPRCPKLEDSTPRLPPPLKRQVGLFPVDAILVKLEGGDLEPRGGLHGSLQPPYVTDCRIPVHEDSVQGYYPYGSDQLHGEHLMYVYATGPSAHHRCYPANHAHTLDAVARGRVNNSMWPLWRIPMRCFSTEGPANKLISK